MQCKDCAAATFTNGGWRQYNPLQCLFCAARLIQQIGQLKKTKEQIMQRRKAVLADAVAYGLSEIRIRALVAAKTMAVQPLLVKGK